MKKIYSLIKACMSSDMNLFKLKSNNKKLPLLIMFCFMFFIWVSANMMFEKLAPIHLQHIVLSLFVFLTFILTVVEGIYKSGPLIFNCRDDQLLLSLPIERRVVLFVRIFKFYIFELLFNAMFMVPLVVAYVRWADSLSWTFFLTSFVMILMLPIIPIVISCIIGYITSSLVSRFKYKNASQIVISMLFFLGMFYVSYNMDNLFEYLAKNASSVNDLVTKIYYPAGLYANLAINFNFMDLLLFILVNIVIFIITILVLSKSFFKVNSRFKSVSSSKSISIDNLRIKASSMKMALIKKELGTFFKTPVFIINAGFALVLFIIVSIMSCFKFDSLFPLLVNEMKLSKELVMSNLSLLVFGLISAASYMTSITNSVISLEGRNINILKSLPIKTKDILMSKVYSSLVLTTPILILGDIILFIKFKINVFESLLLIVLSILIPLVSHFIGILINLRYPKLDAENSTEVVKQSTSSFLAVMIGMVLFFISVLVITQIVGKVNSTLVLVLATIIYLIIDFVLYLCLVNNGSKKFESLSV